MMIRRQRFSLIFASLLCFFVTIPFSASAHVQNRIDGFRAGIYRNARSETMPYRLFVPRDPDPHKKYPLVLWLHGGAGTGRDNLRQISGGNRSGTHVWIKPEHQARYPSFVLAPQSPDGEYWVSYDATRSTRQLRLALEVLKYVKKIYSIDDSRIYVAGQSVGGFAVWNLIIEHPNIFAAAIPLCGGGDESKAAELVRTPIWAFHGEKDEAVSVEQSRRMIEAIRRAGGTPRYTEYKGMDHVIWAKAFREPELVPWVFAQRLKAQPAR